jgi:hypothetical protein
MNIAIDLNNVHSNKEKIIIQLLFPNIPIISCSYNKIEYDKCVTFNYFYGTNFHLFNEGIFNYNNTDTFGISGLIYSCIPINLSNDEYIKQKILFYKNNACFDEIKKEADTFINTTFLTDDYISVHIRYTDNLNDICKNSNNLNTPIEEFYNKLELIKDKKILICSDNADIINELKNKNMYYFPNNINNELIQPIYEMYLLSRSKLIIGSTSSTFSYEAAFFQGTDIELYENKKWVLL